MPTIQQQAPQNGTQIKNEGALRKKKPQSRDNFGAFTKEEPYQPVVFFAQPSYYYLTLSRSELLRHPDLTNLTPKSNAEERGNAYYERLIFHKPKPYTLHLSNHI